MYRRPPTVSPKMANAPPAEVAEMKLTHSSIDRAIHKHARVILACLTTSFLQTTIIFARRSSHPPPPPPLLHHAQSRNFHYFATSPIGWYYVHHHHPFGAMPRSQHTLHRPPSNLSTHGTHYYTSLPPLPSACPVAGAVRGRESAGGGANGVEQVVFHVNNTKHTRSI